MPRPDEKTGQRLVQLRSRWTAGCRNLRACCRCRCQPHLNRVSLWHTHPDACLQQRQHGGSAHVPSICCSISHTRQRPLQQLADGHQALLHACAHEAHQVPPLVCSFAVQCKLAVSYTLKRCIAWHLGGMDLTMLTAGSV